MRERAARGIGLVFTDDSKGLTASVVTHGCHGRAEMHARRILGRRRPLTGRSPRVTISKVAPRARGRATIVGSLRGGMFASQTREFTLDLREPLRRHQIGMRRNRTLWQLLERVLAVRFFDECSAHGDANNAFRSAASADTASRA